MNQSELAIGKLNAGCINSSHHETFEHEQQIRSLLETEKCGEYKRVHWVLFGWPGEHVCSYIQNYLPQESRLIVVELSKNLEVNVINSLQNKDNIFTSGLADLYIADSIDECAKAVSDDMDLENFETWRPLVLNDMKLVESKQLYQALGSFLNYKVVNRVTAKEHSLTFIKNAFINAVLTRPNFIKNIKEFGDQRPVLVVSPGPSLEKQLPILKKYQDKFLLLVPSVAFKLLDQYEIKPDIVISVDVSNKKTWSDDAIGKSLVDICVNPNLLWSCRENLLTVTHSKPVYDLFKAMNLDIDYLPSGGSVATTAFSVAKLLDKNPIVFIGQDLAMSEKASYSKGFDNKYSQERLSKELANSYLVEGYYGEEVSCPKNLMMFKHWFEQEIKADPTRLVFNCTEGGAKITGAIQMPFSKLCEEIACFDLDVPDYKNFPSAEINDANTKIQEQITYLINAIRELINQLCLADSKIEKLKFKNKKLAHKTISDTFKLLSNTRAQTRAVIDLFATKGILELRHKHSIVGNQKHVDVFISNKKNELTVIKDSLINAKTFLESLGEFMEFLHDGKCLEMRDVEKHLEYMQKFELVNL